MKTKFISLLFLNTLLFLVCYSQQASNIIWERSYGGSGAESPTSLKQTSDKGFVLVGLTDSNDGDVSNNHGGQDIWVLKCDSSNAIQWQICIGGTADEFSGWDMVETIDSGLIIAGSTSSTDGDVIGTHGGGDAFVVKLDKEGVIKWKKCYGGSAGDGAFSICKQNDNSFVIGGVSSSNNGDVLSNNGLGDAWVFCIDSVGNYKWGKSFGGSHGDFIYSLTIINNEIIAVGETSSNDFDITGNHGGNDLFVVSLSDSGNIKWNKCFGGSFNEAAFSVIALNTNKFLLGGYTSSFDADISFDHGGGDAWLIEIDSSGNKIWEKCYGGNKYEAIIEIIQDNDSTIVGIGSTYSNNSGDVSFSHDNSGQYSDCWVLQIDTSGVLRKQQCLGCTMHDDGYSICKTDENEYVFLGRTETANGDVSSVHGASSWSSDSWLVKIDDIVSVPADTQILVVTVYDSISVFPNPARDVLYIHSNYDCWLKIINELSQQCGTYFIHSNSPNAIDISHLHAATYFLEFRISATLTIHQKLIVE